jgi:hypothetical protein
LARRAIGFKVDDSISKSVMRNLKLGTRNPEPGTCADKGGARAG